MSASTLRNYWHNLHALGTQQPPLRPLAVTYYVTTHCNLNCVYCEDFGARRNGLMPSPLPLAQAQQVVQLIRTGSDALILTGGEPLLYPAIDPLVAYARHELKFAHLTMLTNAFLLDHHEPLLRLLDRVVISLDAVDPDFWCGVIDMPRSYADRILANIVAYAKRQSEWGFRLVLNSVLTPATLPHAEALLAFAQEHEVLISFSPQLVHYWPSYDLLVSADYVAFIDRLIELKREGAPILGSMAYLHTLRQFEPYACYPTLIPRVMTNGDLTYPCRPLANEGNTHGGRPCNLLEVGSWDEAMGIAVDTYGPPPTMCTSCFQQCFAEPSLMQAQPLALLQEWLGYAPSREGHLLNHAPG